jgi:hypothetical protein
MDIYMMPSLFEGFGLAMVESISKKSIVCSNSISLSHEIFTDKEVSSLKDNPNL